MWGASVNCRPACFQHSSSVATQTMMNCRGPSSSRKPRRTPLVWVRRVSFSAFIAFVAFPLSGEMAPAYRARVKLPVTVFTGDGIRIEKGEVDLGLRPGRKRFSLAFLDQGKVIATVNGLPRDSEKAGELVPTVPLTGTIYLRAAPPTKCNGSSPAEDEKKKEKNGPQDRAEFPLADHLVRRPWKASLRIYGFAQAESDEVHFVFQEEARPGEWLIPI